MLKKLFKYILYYLNLIIPIYSKDFIYKYDFQTGKINKVENLNLRKYEMQYYNDFDDKLLISRFSKYLINKEISLLYYSFKNKQCIKNIRLNKEYNTIRILENKIYGTYDGKLYNILTDDILFNIQSDEFDFFYDNSKNYMLIKDKIFIMKKGFNEIEFVTFMNLPYIKNRRDYSITFFREKYFLVCREGEKQAYETKLVLYTSKDLRIWNLEKILVDSKKLKHLGIDGVGFPTIRVIDGNLQIFFSCFWGKHLFRNKTVKYWSQI